MPMRRAAIGIRVHSGWGALVVISGSLGAEEIIERRKVVIIDAKLPGVAQPYHFAERMELRAAERHLAKCATDSKRLALDSLREIIGHLHQRDLNPVVSAILLSSARALPDLDEILASHALIHTAEGEFFRQAFRHSLERLDVPVTGIRERDLEQRATDVFGQAVSRWQKRIDGLGSALGPPWTVDEKSAALAAAIALAEN